VRVGIAGAVLLAAAACERPKRDVVSGSAASVEIHPAGATPRAPATLPAAGPGAEDGQWPMAAKDYANTRFSGLDEINAGNVSQLKLAWTFSTGSDRGHEAAPVVVGSTMYVITPFPHTVYALDLAATGASTKWSYQPPFERAAEGVACCDVVNRGVAYADGKIFFNTLDNQTIALDAESGRELWRVKMGDINQGETMTMAPIVVKGKVITGNSGGELGVRGWVAALDAGSGATVWKAYSTGPDADVLIGPDFKPFYASERGKDLGVSTWPPGAWQQGGGTVWGWISYDPELDLLYHGTANPGPWNALARPGDNKWTAGVFARNPDSGQARWFYQFTHHDLFDYDGINEMVLLDLPIGGGAPRRVLVHPDRNGHLYVLDRTTGQVLSAEPFGYVNSNKGVDLETGRLIWNEAKIPQMGKVTREICPTSAGAKDWQPSAWSPRTGLLYIPHQNICMDWEAVEANYIAGTPYVGVNSVMYAGPGGHRGVLTAWDPVAARPAWTIEENFPVWSGALATAGDVVFYGTMDRYFKAIDARSGRLLWQFQTGSGIIGQPVSYRGPDGKQYIAVLDGVGGWAGAIVSAGLSPEDATAGGGWVGAMSDLPRYTNKGGTLYVFALP
jgi:PQQ-dependent dehydrogenase (methanol/ethanol family)